MSAHSIQYYFEKAQPVFSAIPGMTELRHAEGSTYEQLSGQYPDAAFALMTANNLFQHDREFSEIYQQAFFSIVDGQDIPTVRYRYEKNMDAYFQRHAWDD